MGDDMMWWLLTHAKYIPWGVRETPLTKRQVPVGYVGYCEVCNWSTSICVGLTNDLTAYNRADTKLRNHLKGRDHNEKVQAHKT
jgi:hypothetical protein